MSKTVTKLLPDKLVFISKIESWLNDMAKKGLKLKFMRAKYAVFEKAEPRDTQYCIVELKKYPDAERLKNYNEEFWGLTCQIKTIFSPDYIRKGCKFYVFETTDSYNERPTKKVFGKKKRPLGRFKSQKTKFIYFLLLMFAALVAAYFNISEHYLLFLPSILLTIAALFAVLTIISLFDRSRIRKMEKENKELGRADEAGWKKFSGRHRRRTFIKTVCWILVFANMFYIIYAFTEMLTPSHLENTDEFVSLDDIQGMDDGANVSYGTWIPSVFVPSFYSAEETGSMIDDEGRHIKLRYDIVYSRCIVPYAISVANGNCVLMRLIDEGYGKHVMFTSTDYFDRVAYISDIYTNGEHYVKICLSNEYEMIYLTYSGDKTVQEIIAVIESKLK